MFGEIVVCIVAAVVIGTCVTLFLVVWDAVAGLLTKVKSWLPAKRKEPV